MWPYSSFFPLLVRRQQASNAGYLKLQNMFSYIPIYNQQIQVFWKSPWKANLKSGPCYIDRMQFLMYNITTCTIFLDKHCQLTISRAFYFPLYSVKCKDFLQLAMPHKQKIPGIRHHHTASLLRNIGRGIAALNYHSCPCFPLCAKHLQTLKGYQNKTPPCGRQPGLVTLLQLYFAIKINFNIFL